MKEVKETIENIQTDLENKAPGCHTNEELKDSAHGDTEGREPHDPRSKYNIFSLLGILLAVAAWIMLSFKGEIALGLSIASFICACFGLKASTRSWRNTAITAIVSSAVLMVVLSAFLIVIYIGLDSL